MRRQRGMGLIGYLIGATIAAVVITSVIVWINHFIKVTWEDPAYERGSNAQLGKDSVVLEQVKTERENARTDTVSCVNKAQVQSDLVDLWQNRAKSNAAAAKDARIEAQRQATAAAPKIADLQAKAAAAPKLMACEQELALSKGAMRTELERRRGIGPPLPLPAPVPK